MYSNIFVAICSVALTHLTYLLLNLPKGNNTPVLLLVFCSTFFTYNIQRVIRLNYQELIGKNIGIRLGWIVRNRALLLSSSLLILLISCCTLFFLNRSTLLTIIPLALLSILYVTPFIPYQQKFISLRTIPFIKIFIIAMVWTLVTVVIPYVNESGFSNFNNSNFAFVLLTRFLFIFAITLPFDVRDLRYDKNAKLKTIPSAIGAKSTIILSELLLLSYALILFFQYYFAERLSLEQFIALISSIAVCMIIISFSIKKRPELYYSGLIESSMIILHFGILVLEY